MGNPSINSGEKVRDNSIDNAKGILIVFVVMGNINFIEDLDILKELIYLFHLPMFFALAMLFVKPFSTSYLQERAKRLLLPYLFFVSVGPYVTDMLFSSCPKLLQGNLDFSPIQWVWLVLGSITFFYFLFIAIDRPTTNIKFSIFRIWVGVAAVSLCHRMLTDKDFWYTYLEALIYSNWWHLESVFWFLPALFSMTILTSVLIKFPALYPIRWLIFSCTFAILPLLTLNHNEIPWGIDVAIVVLPLGFAFRWNYEDKKDILHFISGPSDKLLLGFFLFLLILIVFNLNPEKLVNGFSHKLDLAQLNVPPAGVPFIYLAASGLFYFLLTYNSKSIFSAIGKKTMPIFCLHIPLLEALKSNIGLFHTIGPMYQIRLIAVITVLITYLISLIFERIDRRFAYLGLA